VYLLRYKRDGEWRFVVIADAYSVAHARMVATGPAAGRFVNGHAVSRASMPGTARCRGAGQTNAGALGLEQV
jgi:hypothetical protein